VVSNKPTVVDKPTKDEVYKYLRSHLRWLRVYIRQNSDSLDGKKTKLISHLLKAEEVLLGKGLD